MKRSKMLEMAERSLREGRLEGIVDVPKSGRWGQYDYYMRGGKQCCRRHVVPTDRRSGAQRQARSALGSAAKAWGTKLTETERSAWEAAAMEEWSKPRLGQSGELSGEQVFTRRSCVLLRVGKEMVLWPTPRPAFAPNPVEELIVTNGSDGVRIKLRVRGPVVDDVVVFGQAPCSAGRKRWRHGAYLCLLPAPANGESDITVPYVARYGEPEPGQKVFIRTRQQRDGWEDLERDVSEVVPVSSAAGDREMAVGRTGVQLNELNGFKELNKVPDERDLRGLDGLPKAKVGGSRGGRSVRCTSGWCRVATVLLPWQCRCTIGRGIRKAEGGMENGGTTGGRRRGHRRELWHGS